MANFLKYAKTVVSKVSFDRFLLNKEYKKCLDYLSYNEREKFRAWLSRQKFARQLETVKVSNNRFGK